MLTDRVLSVFLARSSSVLFEHFLCCFITGLLHVWPWLSCWDILSHLLCAIVDVIHFIVLLTWDERALSSRIGLIRIQITAVKMVNKGYFPILCAWFFLFLCSGPQSDEMWTVATFYDGLLAFCFYCNDNSTRATFFHGWELRWATKDDVYWHNYLDGVFGMRWCRMEKG